MNFRNSETELEKPEEAATSREEIMKLFENFCARREALRITRSPQHPIAKMEG